MKIGITQRVEIVAAYGEVRDCLDQKWMPFLERVGVEGIPIPNSLNDPVGWFKKLELDGLVLSGGNDLSSIPGGTNTSEARDRTELLLLEHCKQLDISVIGVCRGMQLMGDQNGMELEPITNHVATRHQIEGGISDRPRQVNSFHNWCFRSLPKNTEFSITSMSEDGAVESFEHHTLPWYGIMWHPEREQTFDEQDISLFKNIFKVD